MSTKCNFAANSFILRCVCSLLKNLMKLIEFMKGLQWQIQDFKKGVSKLWAAKPTWVLLGGSACGHAPPEIFCKMDALG